MQSGDFTELAKDYVYRTGYSHDVLDMLAFTVGKGRRDLAIADVGAGTGKLSDDLMAIGLSCWAIEPNDAMREEGRRLSKDPSRVVWLKGSAEELPLPEASLDWVLMASSFHWADSQRALAEFARVLKPGGYFTALWNPRDPDRHSLHRSIEEKIQKIAPDIRRRSSGAKPYTADLEKTLLSTGRFGNLIFAETPYEIMMTKERYLGIWRSVNDIRSQAGEEKFGQILKAIEEEIKDMDDITVPYRTRAWTVRLKEAMDARK